MLPCALANYLVNRMAYDESTVWFRVQHCLKPLSYYKKKVWFYKGNINKSNAAGNSKRLYTPELDRENNLENIKRLCLPILPYTTTVTTPQQHYTPKPVSASCHRSRSASKAVVLKLFLIVYHFCVPYCYHVPPCSRKSQCAKYHSIKSLENQN